MGVIPNPKMAFIFPISCILALIFPILKKYFPKCVGKGSFPKSQIKSLWESAHAWNLIILCLLIVWGMTFIFMVHLSFYAIPLLIYDVMYDITTTP